MSGWSWDVLSDAWDEGFARLQAFADQEGHCRVPQLFKTDDGYRLGSWVRTQRANKEKLEPSLRHKLESLPNWHWVVFSETWDEGYEHLKMFAENEGHCRVPVDFCSNDGFRLGVWVSMQRGKRDNMDLCRQKRLEDLPFWTWDVLSTKWEEGYRNLRVFLDREGHCRVPTAYKAENGFKLGQWVSVQRTNRRRMDADRRARLESLTGWVWTTRK